MCLSCTVTEIFSVEYWRDLEICTRGRSTSLIMAPVDRSYRTCYWSAVVTVALSCTIFESFDVE